MQRHLALILALALGAAAPAARAGEAQDLIFATGALDAVETGAELVYDYTRAGTRLAPPRGAVADGRVTLGIEPAASGERAASLTLAGMPEARILDPFPAGAGNPVFLFFMEETVRNVAALTGGSPFYIRNRMREALRSQDEFAPVEIAHGADKFSATRLTFRPFAGDPNAARMRGFEALTLTLAMSDAVPGGFVTLEAVVPPDPPSADAPPVFLQRLAFAGAEPR